MPTNWDHPDHDPTSPLAGRSSLPAHALSDCIDAAESPCGGQHFARLALSGSGQSYVRCDTHYEAYAARLQPILDDIRRRYPLHPPADFDPTAIGEVWSEDDY